MFDFENLIAYKKSKSLNKEIQEFLKSTKNLNPYLKNQLNRASISMVINIAEGCGKFSSKEKRQFYYISRASIYECISILDLIKEDGLITEKLYQYYYIKFEEISKIIMGLIKSCK